MSISAVMLPRFTVQSERDQAGRREKQAGQLDKLGSRTSRTHSGQDRPDHRVHIVTRDETGLAYLPIQLERTLQLY
jgi:hypothetical protein